MGIFAYLRSRVALIIGHILASGLCIAVIQLDLFHTGRGLTPDSLVYLLILNLTVLGVVLLIDYLVQYRFYRSAVEVEHDFTSADSILALALPRTPEQRIMYDLLQTFYGYHREQVAKRDSRSALHLDFVNRWAHAMKTPVSVIDLLCQQARTISTPEELRGLLESVEEEKDRLAHGLEMMLGMARQERFAMDLWPQQVDLAQVAREVVNKHKKEFIRYGLYPKVEVLTEHCTVETDYKWISFVIDQLVTNGIKYTRVSPTGSKLVLRIEGSPKEIQLTVEDDGIGIPPHDLPRVFEPFFTGENGRLVPESTGMGLYLARRICEELGHTLQVKSTPQRGTQVIITFQTRAITKQEV